MGVDDLGQTFPLPPGSTVGRADRLHGCFVRLGSFSQPLASAGPRGFVLVHGLSLCVEAGACGQGNMMGRLKQLWSQITSE